MGKPCVLLRESPLKYLHGDSLVHCCRSRAPSLPSPPVCPAPRGTTPQGPKMTTLCDLTHAAPQEQRFLVLFDFDETIINVSSDDAVVCALPGQQLPEWLKNCFREGHYNEHMQKVLAYMAEQGVSEDGIRSVLEKIPPTPGLLNLFQYLQSNQQDFELLVVSDANMFFIETWLEHAGVRPLFRKIFTNPASFDATGQLMLLPFHSHSCSRCPDNMCKQVIMQEYLSYRQKERGGTPYQGVFYIGDGANDVCPSMALGPRDTAFPRRDFPMHSLLQGMQQSQSFKANMVPWASGEDIVDYLRKIMKERRDLCNRGDERVEQI
ncbi:probable phosphatase phospho1 isoform X2 [Pleuronectes platessa]|uniref:probable phosphatase phospho1 isoform X2 n=1 Tax=Pleuronectes platessa TaxID=8262 RepID=UPI00232A24BC|nr:probable phosphatase phospho1 isoform X2 [Pleuronectes platessa]